MAFDVTNTKCWVLNRIKADACVEKQLGWRLLLTVMGHGQPFPLGHKLQVWTAAVWRTEFYEL